MELEEFHRLVAFCRENKIKATHFDNIKFIFDDSAYARPEEPAVASKLPIADPDLEMPSDEEMLFRSTDIVELKELKS